MDSIVSGKLNLHQEKKISGFLMVSTETIIDDTIVGNSKVSGTLHRVNHFDPIGFFKLLFDEKKKVI